MSKPKQKYELNFQEDISEQLGKMTTAQLVKLLYTIISIIPLSEAILQYPTEFQHIYNC